MNWNAPSTIEIDTFRLREGRSRESRTQPGLAKKGKCSWPETRGSALILSRRRSISSSSEWQQVVRLPLQAAPLAAFFCLIELPLRRQVGATLKVSLNQSMVVR